MKKIKTNKKAISNIIVSVLLIVIAMIAVVALSAVIKKLKEPLLSPQSCLDIKLNKLVSYNACYDEENNEIRVNINNLGTEVNSLDFLLIGEQVETYSCGCLNCELDKNAYYISSSKPDKLALRINDCLLDEVDVVDC